MGKDSRGVERGKCGKCDCPQFLYDKEKYATRCANCGHVPTVHTAIPVGILVDIPVSNVALTTATIGNEGKKDSVVPFKSEQDSQGIARGECTLDGCQCDQFCTPRRGVKCAVCGHTPVKHKKQNAPLIPCPSAGMHDEGENDEMERDSAVKLFVSRQKDNRIVEAVQNAESLASPLKDFSGISLLSDRGTTKLSDHLSVDDIEDDDILKSAAAAADTGPSTPSKVKRRLLSSRHSNFKQKPLDGPLHQSLPVPSVVVKKKKRSKNLATPSHIQNPYDVVTTSNQTASTLPNPVHASGYHQPVGSYTLPPQTTATNPVYQSSPVQQAPAAGGCIYPGCTRPVCVEPDGKTHQFCSRTHARMYQQSQTASTHTTMYQHSTTTVVPPHLKCSNPNCNRMKYVDQNGQSFDYCGKSCRDNFRRQQGQGPQTMIGPADACLLRGCHKPRFHDQHGTYDYCGKSHAKQAQKRLLRIATPNEFQQAKTHFIHQWAKGTCGVLDHVLIIENEKLKNRFQNYLASLSGYNTVSKHYHGTSLKCAVYQTTAVCTDKSCGICGISQRGFLAEYKSTNIKFQRFGDGYYLAPNSSKCHDYTQGHGVYRAMLLFDVAEGRRHTLQRDNSTLKAPPSGYHSVYGKSGGSLNYDEIVVYTPEAVLPTLILIYRKDGIHKIAM